VKSAAYLQTWFQTTLSAVSFDIGPKRHWDAATNVMATEARRQADLYVFALLAHREKATLDPMDVAQWVFCVLPTAVLNARLPTQKRVSLATLLKLDPAQCVFGQLRDVIEDVARTVPKHEL
jgi:hypothetical protein